MAQDQFEEEIDLRRYIAIVLRKWWVVVIVFIIVLGYAVNQTQRMPDIYEARTKLLIVPPLSERILTFGQIISPDGTNRRERLSAVNPLLGSNLSVETLVAMGTANDLLRKVIITLRLRDSITGDYWPVERIQSAITVDVQSGGQGNSSLPLLTMTVRGGDPPTLKLIAESWAKLFVEQNSQLFATEAARSYDFVIGLYDDTSRQLRSKEEEKLAYQQANSSEALTSELKVLTAKYQDFLTQLHQKKATLVEARAKLASAENAILSEPQFVTLQKSISNEAILAILAGNSERINFEELPNLISLTQERNELYFSLRADIVKIRSDVSSLESDIIYLGAETKVLENKIDDISIEVAERTVNLNRLDRQLKILTENFSRLGQSLQETQIANKEESGFIQAVESAVVPTVPIGPDRRRTHVIGAISGAGLGVVMAFIVHFILEAIRNNKKERPTEES